MRAGRLDRRITLKRNEPTQSDTGELIENWVEIESVKAKVRYDRGDERFATQQTVGHAVVTFTIRWGSAWSDLNTKDRITYDGRDFNIRDVRELGRRVGMEIDAVARNETPLVTA